jgi:hypothetical protein
LDIALPYARDRRYLTGIDWIIGVLDRMTRSVTGSGNTSQIILELEGRLDPDRFRAAVARFASHFPAMTGWPARDWKNLAPYWKIDGRSGTPGCSVSAVDERTSDDEILALLGRGADAPFPTRRDHLLFNLVHAGARRTFLGMVFDHWLFDARGAELFLDRLNAWQENPSPPIPPELGQPVREPHLSRWADKFRAGRKINRAIRGLAGLDVGRFPIPEANDGRRAFRHHFLTLDEAESGRFTETAYALGGYLVLLPYLLAVAARAVDGVFAGRGLEPGHFVVPVSIDRRSERAESQSLFFNHCSFLHFLISREDLPATERLVKRIADQMYEQIRSGLAGDFEQTMLLMRILPVGALAGIARRLFGGNFGSFAFSYVGRSAIRSEAFFGHRILNLRHAPRVSTPPGVGVFVNAFGGKLNFTTAYLDDTMSDKEAGALTACFRADLAPT